MMTGVLNGMMTGVLLDGTKVGNKRMTLPHAHFHVEFLDLGAMSSPKRFEGVRMKLDTGAAVNTFPLNFGPEGARDGRFYRSRIIKQGCATSRYATRSSLQSFQREVKEMIHSMGNVEYFEMCEISPSVKFHICCRQ